MDEHLDDLKRSYQNGSRPSDSDSDNDLTNLNLTRFNNSTNLFRRLTNIGDDLPHQAENTEKNGDQPKLTFEQYVKKLTGKLVYFKFKSISETYSEQYVIYNF